LFPTKWSFEELTGALENRASDFLFSLLTFVRLSFNMRCRFSPGAAAANPS
jgi:hypothetical protein